MKIRLFLLSLFYSMCLFSQEQLPLENMNGFRNQAGNWIIVGDVTADRNIDVHTVSEHKTTSKKKKRKKKNNTEPAKPVIYKSGSGVLYNNYSATKKDHLLSEWEHGDLKLEMEVLIPKGSNSGIYLQGRYELQIKDSWGTKQPMHNDFGGIHRNWEEKEPHVFRGIAPLTNAAKAPGLWQKLKIHFQAPRFNSQGEKIENARFVYVDLNGIRIHNNVEVPLPTGGPISKTEAALGPLMIQGDHGPMAFKNIKYQLLADTDISISSLSYKTAKANFKGLETLNTAISTTEKNAKNIDITATNEEDNYGIVYNGILNVNKQSNYTFTIGFTGGIDFEIDGKSVIRNNSADAQQELKKTISLTPGAHKFKLTNIKSAGWRAPRLGLTIAENNGNPKQFHALDSYPPSINSVSPIYVQPNAKPVLLRGFVNFKGNGKRLSHTIGVGTPDGINYVYDLAAANLIGVWRGDFVDATPMWHNRGNGSFNPKGAVQWTFLNQPIAALPTMQTKFPKTGITPDFKSLGYTIDSDTGLPLFKSEYEGVTVTNKIKPSSNKTHLMHEVSFSKTSPENWYYKIASGTIEVLKDGSYAINDQGYYIKILSDQQPTIRTINEESELLIPVNGSTIKYEIIW